jgi:hypothetical protein
MAVKKRAAAPSDGLTVTLSFRVTGEDERRLRDVLEQLEARVGAPVPLTGYVRRAVMDKVAADERRR